MITEEIKLLTSDLCFKYVFSKKIILEDFLNSFLKYLNLNIKASYDEIIPESYIMPNHKKLILYTGDIVGYLSNGDVISIEMYKNTFSKKDYNKSLAYTCRLFDQNVKDSKRYEASKIYSINLIKGNFRKINSKLVNTYSFQSNDSKQIDNGSLEMYLIRFDKVKEIAYTINEERFIRWLRIINAKNYEELSKYCKGDGIMEEVREFVKRWNEESNKGGFEKYVEEQKEEATVQGIKQGKKAGILETAKNLISLNIDINDISKATGLSEKEINKLKKRLVNTKFYSEK